MTDSRPEFQRFTETFGRAPSSFASTIRHLITDNASDPSTITPENNKNVISLLSGRTAKTVFYFASKTLHEDIFEVDETPSQQTLIDSYDSYTLASIIAFTFLYKRSQRLCHQDDWHLIGKPLSYHANLGAHIGLTFPDIGPGFGMLASAIAYVSFAMFLACDETTYKSYKNHLRTSKQFFDSEFEIKKWNCTSAEIGSHLLLTMGFGGALAFDYIQAFSAESEKAVASSDIAQRIYKARKWVEVLHKHELRDEIIDTRLNAILSPEEKSNFISRLTELKQKADLHNWLDKDKNDSPAIISA